jgi:hypothetical protein
MSGNQVDRPAPPQPDRTGGRTAPGDRGNLTSVPRPPMRVVTKGLWTTVERREQPRPVLQPRLHGDDRR